MPHKPLFVMSASCFGMAVVYLCMVQVINISLITASSFMHVLVARISLHSNKSLSLIKTHAILETCDLLYSSHRILAALFLDKSTPSSKSMLLLSPYNSKRIHHNTCSFTSNSASLKRKMCKALKITH